MILQLENVDFTYLDKTILKNISFSVDNLDRIGLIGDNGSGKTTLIRVILGELKADSGSLYKKSGLKIGYLPQNALLNSDDTVFCEMQKVFAETLKIEGDMLSLSEEMASATGDNFSKLSAEYERLVKRYDALDGYNVDVKIKTVLNGLGFKGLYDRTVNTFSGGEKTRLALAKLLLDDFELLILDEPTNHLDFETLNFLENFLASYKGAIIVVSHDRFFLDKAVTSIVELEEHTATRYRGNYTTYKRLKQEKNELQLREYEKQQEEIAKLEDYIARNLVRASTTKMAQSRRTELEKIVRIEKPVRHLSPHFAFSFDIEPTKQLLSFSNLELRSPSGEVLASGMSLDVNRGERVAVVGKNGTGKSTLLKYLLANFGKFQLNVKFGQNIIYSFYDQENSNLDFNQKLLDEMWNKYPRSTLFALRKVLGQLLFTDDDMSKKICDLSGGMRAKIGFAVMMLTNANFLIMDEPTNHLDLESREALEDALLKFEGTVLFVSHDRYFLEKLATKTAEIEDGKMNVFTGGFDAYLAAKQEKPATEELPQQLVQEEKPKMQEKSGYRSTEDRKNEAKRRIRTGEIEKRISDLEAENDDLIAEISSGAYAKDYLRLQEKCARQEQIKNELDALYQEWDRLNA